MVVLFSVHDSDNKTLFTFELNRRPKYSSFSKSRSEHHMLLSLVILLSISTNILAANHSSQVIEFIHFTISIFPMDTLVPSSSLSLSVCFFQSRKQTVVFQLQITLFLFLIVEVLTDAWGSVPVVYKLRYKQERWESKPRRR